MPYIARVIKTWSIDKPSQMIALTEYIIKKMTGNINFNNPPISMTELDAANKVTLAAYSNRKNGTQAKNELIRAADTQNTMLLKISDYISENALGDVVKILSTGFEVTKEGRTKAVVPDVPNAPKLSSSNGSLYMNTDKVLGADNYCWVIYTTEVQPIQVIDSQLNISALANTILVPAGTTRESVKGIAAGTKVTVQVLAQNSAGKSTFSTSATLYVNC